MASIDDIEGRNPVDATTTIFAYSLVIRVFLNYYLVMIACKCLEAEYGHVSRHRTTSFLFTWHSD